MIINNSFLLQIDGRIEGHAYGRLDGHKDTQTEPNCIVIKIFFYRIIGHKKSAEYPVSSQTYFKPTCHTNRQKS